MSLNDNISAVIKLNFLRNGGQGPGANVNLHLGCERALGLRRRRSRARRAPLDLGGSGSKLGFGPEHSEGAAHLGELHPLVVLLHVVHGDLCLGLPLCENVNGCSQ